MWSTVLTDGATAALVYFSVAGCYTRVQIVGLGLVGACFGCGKTLLCLGIASLLVKRLCLLKILSVALCKGFGSRSGHQQHSNRHYKA